MVGRSLALTLVVALAGGCAAAPVATRFQPDRPADPARFERAACLRGDYPAEVDARAYAQARTTDRSAERGGLASPGATSRLLVERAAFDARCASWRDGAESGLAQAGGRGAPFVTASFQAVP